MTVKRQLEQLTNSKESQSVIMLLCYASTAGALNKMKELEASLKFGLEQKIVSEIEYYETLLQLYLFAGFPAAIESLSVLNAIVEGKKIRNSVSAYDVELFINRGEKLCKTIYTTVYEKMRLRLQKISPELDQWMILEGYGKTLSRKGLSLKTRELITVSSLAALGWDNQLYSHVRGALSVGSSPEECYEILEVLELLCEQETIKKAKIIIESVVKSIL